MNKQNDQVLKDLASHIAPETVYETTVINSKGQETKIKFRIFHWKPTRVYQMLPRIGKVIGVPISMILSTTLFSLPKNDSESAKEVLSTSFSEAVPAALLQLFQTLDEEHIMDFIKDILEGVHYEGKPINDNIDSIFINHPQLILELVIKVLEVTYAPFIRLDFQKMLKVATQITGIQQATSPQQ